MSDRALSLNPRREEIERYSAGAVKYEVDLGAEEVIAALENLDGKAAPPREGASEATRHLEVETNGNRFVIRLRPDEGTAVGRAIELRGSVHRHHGFSRVVARLRRPRVVSRRPLWLAGTAVASIFAATAGSWVAWSAAGLFAMASVFGFAPRLDIPPAAKPDGRQLHASLAALLVPHERPPEATPYRQKRRALPESSR